MARKKNAGLSGVDAPFEGVERFDGGEHTPALYPDDGSHRLLVAPCVLVVVVMLLLLTACSPADGDETDDGAAGEVGESAAVESAEAQADAGAGEAGITAPEVMGDGRMIQPTGHTGIWFETEPHDPLEKLVYESQRFVGQPVELEPIGERALLPQWEDMPDPCHPEVLSRMGELGLETVEDDEVAYGMVHCSVLAAGAEWTDRGIIAFDWGIVDDVHSYSKGGEIVHSSIEGISFIEGGEMADLLGCVATMSGFPGGVGVVSSFSSLGEGIECSGSMMTLQIAINSNGGEFSV